MRIVFTLLILFMAASLQAACAAYFSSAQIAVDFLLVAVSTGALVMRGGPLFFSAIVAAVFKDAFSLGVFGHSIVVFTVIAFVVKGIRNLLWVGHWTTQAAVAFSSTFAACFLYALLQWVWGDGVVFEGWFTLKNALLNAVIAPFVYWIWRCAESR